MFWRRIDPVTAPAPLIDLAQAKAHLRVDWPEEDTLITAICATVEEFLSGPESILSRGLVNRQWMAVFEGADFCGPGGPGYAQTLRLACEEIVSIDLFEVLIGGVYVTLAPTQYALWRTLGGGAVSAPQGITWPVPDVGMPAQIRITLTTGYGATSAKVPAPIRHAALLMLGYLYDKREATAGSALYEGSAAALLANYRVGV